LPGLGKNTNNGCRKKRERGKKTKPEHLAEPANSKKEPTSQRQNPLMEPRSEEGKNRQVTARKPIADQNQKKKSSSRIVHHRIGRSAKRTEPKVKGVGQLATAIENVKN